MVQGDESGVEGFVAVCLLVENGLVVDRGEAVDEGDGVGGHGGDRRVVKNRGKERVAQATSPGGCVTSIDHPA